MNKTLKVLMMLLCSLAFSQQKSTGTIVLNSMMTANFSLNSTTSIVTLTLTGPNDRWFALQFGSFANGGGMLAGTDVVFWNNVTLVDGRQNGIGVTPSTDAVNNWSLVSNVNNSPSTGLRTLVFTRAFSTGDVNDYVFNFANTSIDLAWSRASSAGYTLGYHGSNRGYAIDSPFTTLATDVFSLNSSLLYPNPSHGIFTIDSKVRISKVSLYAQNGVFLKSFSVDGDSVVELDLSFVSPGVYLLELSDDSAVYWKKIVIE